jgi:hypothetical protein
MLYTEVLIDIQKKKKQFLGGVDYGQIVGSYEMRRIWVGAVCNAARFADLSSFICRLFFFFNLDLNYVNGFGLACGAPIGTS